MNCALNLGGSSDLALHTRHSAVFTLTPVACGTWYQSRNQQGKLDEVGYVDTRFFGPSGGPTLGQAVAVSGAAASPNMGYHTSSAAVTFVLTLFNARLGCGWAIRARRAAIAGTRCAPRCPRTGARSRA